MKYRSNITSQCFSVFLISTALFLFFSCSQPSEKKPVWQDDFANRKTFDTAYWSKIPRGGSDWNNFMSFEDTLYGQRNNKLILRGMENNFVSQDSAPFLTGGVYTKDKKAFGFGRWEIRAKLNGGKGVWPAIWLMPQTTKNNWPDDGEIDIMERLNHDKKVYQTVHSYYTEKLSVKDNPPSSMTAEIDPHQFNTYAVEVHPDKVVFFVNGKKTLTYPKIDTDKKGQFPFADNKYYLLIDMQIGGEWVGKDIDSDSFPVEMEIDWVKFYNL